MTEITYHQEGDYLYPDLVINDHTDRPVGKYGRMRKKFLREHRGGLWTHLLLGEKLMEHLADVQELAEQRIERMMQESLKIEPAPDKATHQMEWVQHMTTLHAMIESQVIREVVFE
jgi:hypothetical protein